MANASRGAAYLDPRIIPPDFDWHAYDVNPEKSKVRPASDFMDEVAHCFAFGRETSGDFWPWDKATDKGLRFRTAEVTVYAGINGHRKSLLTGQIALHLMRQDCKVLMMSFEMQPRETLARMLRQSTASADPAPAYLKAWKEWSRGRIWLYDQYGHCAPRQAVAVARYAIRELGVGHVFIDSLMKVVGAVDDYNGQKTFVNDLCSLAMAEDCHVHLVAHARKGKSEREGIDKWDVKGAGEITDLVHNVMLVSKRLDPEASEPDQWLEVAKQRAGAYEGTLGLYFNSESLSFGERENARWPSINVLSGDVEREAMQSEGA